MVVSNSWTLYASTPCLHGYSSKIPSISGTSAKWVGRHLVSRQKQKNAKYVLLSLDLVNGFDVNPIPRLNVFPWLPMASTSIPDELK
ncbi:unnamed protein product [Calypogeia fissa]